MLHTQLDKSSDRALLKQETVQPPQQTSRKPRGSKTWTPEFRQFRWGSIRLRTPQFGFSSEIWREKAFVIIVLVLRLIKTVSCLTFANNIKLINEQIFKIIGDKAADFQFYLMREMLKNQKPQKLSKLGYELEGSYFKLRRFRWAHLFFSSGFTLKPESKFLLFWNIFSLVMINLAVFYTTAKFAFRIDYRPSQYHQIRQIFCYQIPYYSFIIDILIKLHLQYYHKGHLKAKRIKILQHYIKSDLLVDLTVVLSQMLYQYQKIFNLDTLIILKVIQMPKLCSQLLDKLEFTHKHQALYDLFRLVFLIIIEAHFCTCGFFYVGSLHMDDSYSWIEDQGLQDRDWLEQYFHTFYWSIITMCTIGYGDITPQNIYERLFLIVIALFSCCTFGYALSSIGEIVAQFSIRSNKIRLDMNCLKKYLRVKGYSHDLQIKIRRYFEYIWNEAAEDENVEIPTFLEGVPDYLKKEMVIDLNMKSLKKVPFLVKHFDQPFLQQLASKFIEEKYAPEQQIFAKNQQSEYFYILQEGQVEYFVSLSNTSECITTLQKFSRKDDIFGQYEFFTDSQYSYNCQSASSTRVMKISKSNFLEIAKYYGYEQYCQLRDTLKFSGKTDALGLVCQGCSKPTHFINTCPMVTGFPNKSKLLLLYRRSVVNYRQKWKRQNLERRIQTWKSENDVRDSVILYLLHDKKNQRQMESEFQIETVKNTKVKRMRPVQSKRTGRFSFTQAITPMFLQNLSHVRLKDSNPLGKSSEAPINGLQEITESEEFIIANGLKKQLVFKKLSETSPKDEQSIYDLVQEQRSEYSNPHNYQTRTNSNPQFQLYLTSQQFVMDSNQPDTFTNQTSQDINNIFSKNDISLSPAPLTGVSMGKYKDIFEEFERMQDYECYMPHLNFKAHVNQEEDNIERKTFSKFIRTNVKYKKKQSHHQTYSKLN